MRPFGELGREVQFYLLLSPPGAGREKYRRSSNHRYQILVFMFDQSSLLQNSARLVSVNTKMVQADIGRKTKSETG